MSGEGNSNKHTHTHRMKLLHTGLMSWYCWDSTIVLTYSCVLILETCCTRNKIRHATLRRYRSGGLSWNLAGWLNPPGVSLFYQRQRETPPRRLLWRNNTRRVEHTPKIIYQVTVNQLSFTLPSIQIRLNSFCWWEKNVMFEKKLNRITIINQMNDMQIK